MVCVWETLDNIIDAVDLLTGKAGYFFNIIICFSPLRLLGSKTKNGKYVNFFLIIGSCTSHTQNPIFLFNEVTSKPACLFPYLNSALVIGFVCLTM
jgi:hypothetical protein